MGNRDGVTAVPNDLIVFGMCVGISLLYLIMMMASFMVEPDKEMKPF